MPFFPSDAEIVFWSSGAPELGVAALRVARVFGGTGRIVIVTYYLYNPYVYTEYQITII